MENISWLFEQIYFVYTKQKKISCCTSDSVQVVKVKIGAYSFSQTV